MNKYVIYFRVSGSKQGRDGISLDMQLLQCREYVSRVGGEILGEFSDIQSGYKKKGSKSGRNRAGFNAAVKLAMDNDATLLVALLHRLGRDLEYCLHFKNNGLKISSLDYPICDDTTFNILMTMFEQSSKTTSIAAKQSWAHIKKEISDHGHYYSRREARKFSSITEMNPSWEANRELGPIAASNLRTAEKCADEKWQLARGQALDLRRRGDSYGLIASTLNNTGHRTRRGNLWTFNSVFRLINARTI